MNRNFLSKTNTKTNAKTNANKKTDTNRNTTQIQDRFDKVSDQSSGLQWVCWLLHEQKLFKYYKYKDKCKEKYKHKHKYRINR